MMHEDRNQGRLESRKGNRKIDRNAGLYAPLVCTVEILYKHTLCPLFCGLRNSKHVAPSVIAWPNFPHCLDFFFFFPLEASLSQRNIVLYHRERENRGRKHTAANEFRPSFHLFTRLLLFQPFIQSPFLFFSLIVLSFHHFFFLLKLCRSSCTVFGWRFHFYSPELLC